MHEFVEGVFHLFADLLPGIVQMCLRLIGVTVTLGASVARGLAGRLFGLADEVLGLVLRFIHATHGAGIP